MSATIPSVESLVLLAQQLPPAERARLIQQVAATLVQETSENQSVKRPKRSLLGLWADLGPAPSAEEIDEARREMWGNFPREDI